MDWDSVLRGALIGAVVGGLSGLVAVLFVRKTCPHCDARYKLGVLKARTECPECGRDLAASKRTKRKRRDD